MNHGRVIAEGTPNELKRHSGSSQVELVVPAELLEHCAAILERSLGSPVAIDHDTRTLSVAAATGAQALAAVIRALDAEGITPDDILLRRPTLDEAFLALTATTTPEESA